MDSRDFASFGNRLLASGVDRRAAARLALELSEHFEDIEAALLDDGYGREEARTLAARELGNLDDLAAAIRARRELMSWSHRLGVHRAVRFVPVYAASEDWLNRAGEGAGTVARWGLIVTSSAAITAATLLGMQMAITLT